MNRTVVRNFLRTIAPLLVLFLSLATGFMLWFFTAASILWSALVVPLIFIGLLPILLFIAGTYFPYGCPHRTCCGQMEAIVRRRRYKCPICGDTWEVTGGPSSFHWVLRHSDGSTNELGVGSCPKCNGRLSYYTYFGREQRISDCKKCKHHVDDYV